jgi:hypothetical protein
VGESPEFEKEKIKMNMKLVRSKSAGVFFGEVVNIDGQTVEMRNARRVWYWSGAASLSQLAVDGTSDPKNCKFPVAVSVTVFEVIEIIDMTEKAINSLSGVKIWEK